MLILFDLDDTLIDHAHAFDTAFSPVASRYQSNVYQPVAMYLSVE